MIKRHDGKTTTYIDGIAGSIASVIALASDRVIMPSNTTFFVHKPLVQRITGNADKLREYANRLDNLQASLMSVYKENLAPGATIEEVEALVNKESYLTAEETAKYFNVELAESKSNVQYVASMFDDVEELPQFIKDKLINTIDLKKAQAQLNLLKLKGEKNNMDRTVYENKRRQLVEEAQNFINASNLEEYNRVEEEIKNLDKQFDEEAEAQANLNALNSMVNIVNPINVQNSLGVGACEIEPLNLNTDITNIVDGVLNKEQEEIYVNAWAKDMMNKPLTEAENAIFEAQNSFTHTTGNTGILIPETVVAGIWKEVGEQYPLWEDVFKTSVKGNIKVLKSTSSSEAKWYDEATPTEDGKEEFGEITLTGCELSRDITVSWKLREMAVKEFIPFIQSQLAEKIGAALGYGVANGKGKPGGGDSHKAEPRGIITALKKESETPRVIEYDEATPLDYTMCTKAMSLIKSAYKNGAYIYADNATIWNQLANITDKVGRPYFIADTSTGGVGRILGLTVKEDDSIGEGSILFGNANKGYHANINKEIILDSEEHKKKRETDYIAYGIVDGDVRTLDAFALITKKAVGVLNTKANNKDKNKEE